MKHHLDNFAATNTTYFTSLRIQLNLLLGCYAAYAGEIPLSKKEIADELGCSRARIRKLLAEAESEGFIQLKDEKIFLSKYIDFSDDSDNGAKGYVKHFKFLNTEEFKNESRPVQRFILEMLRHRFYVKGIFPYVTRVNNLYNSKKNQVGTFNINSLTQMLNIIKSAQKYLNIELIELSPKVWSIKVSSIKEEWLALGEVESIGAHTWVKKQLDRAGYCPEFINPDTINQLAKVMHFYYHSVGYENSTRLFNASLKQLTYSQRFYNFMYKENPTSKELDEVSAYFRAVMEEAELNTVEQLTFQFDKFNAAIEKLEKDLDTHKEQQNSSDIILLQMVKLRQKQIAQSIRNFELYWLKEFNYEKPGHSRIYYNRSRFPHIFKHMYELLYTYDTYRKLESMK